jgi:dUTP pyrophosphatase
MRRIFVCRYKADHSPYNDPPTFGSSGAACFDIQAAEDVEIFQGTVVAIPTGLHLEIPQGYEVQIRSRSGFALKHTACVLNAPGTIDSDYTGEIKIIMANFGTRTLYITKGDRVAQGIYSKLVVDSPKDFDWEEIEELKETERGANGFGSTGGMADAK